MKVVACFVLLPTLIAFESNNPTCDTGANAIAYANRTCIKNAGDFTERCYHTYVPKCAAGKNVPLVLDVHALGSCPQLSAFYTGWMQKANSECVVVVWPLGILDKAFSDGTCFHVLGGVPSSDGNSTSPNCCCQKGGVPESMDNIDPAATSDPTFLRNVVLEVVSSIKKAGSLTIDTTRIYMAGHSNGCITSLAMAATNSDIVAAVCCHAGALVTDFPATYSPVPIWLVHGLKDGWLPWAGLTMNAKTFRSMPDAAKYIASKNGCAATAVEGTVGSDGKSYTYSNCVNQSTVELVALTESGHIPYPAPAQEDFPSNPGASQTTLDTTSMAWKFCSSHSKSAAPQAFSAAASTGSTGTGSTGTTGGASSGGNVTSAPTASGVTTESALACLVAAIAIAVGALI